MTVRLIAPTPVATFPLDNCLPDNCLNTSSLAGSCILPFLFDQTQRGKARQDTLNFLFTAPGQPHQISQAAAPIHEQ
jgi:hypothetical protein